MPARAAGNASVFARAALGLTLVAGRAGLDDARAADRATTHVRRLIDDGVLLERDDHLVMRPQAQ